MQYHTNITPQKNNRLDDIATKKMLYQYLFEKINDKNHHINISNTEELNVIRKKGYLVCPGNYGTRSWILFVKIKDDYYAVNFSKNTHINKVKIFPIQITACQDVYNGTIMEGVYMINNGVPSLVIDDVYYLAGKTQLLKSKDDRLSELSQYAHKNFGGNPKFNIGICHFYDINKKNLEDLYNEIKYDNTIQEIIFYPKMYGGKIYRYVILSEDVIDNVVKTMRFIMKKTNKPDEYKLFDIESSEKIDIAIIPDMITSKKCKRWYKDNKTDTLNVTCQYLFDRKKWLPIEIFTEDEYSDESE